MKCKNCGAEIAENSFFCPECGVKIKHEAYKSTVEDETRRIEAMDATIAVSVPDVSVLGNELETAPMLWENGVNVPEQRKKDEHDEEVMNSIYENIASAEETESSASDRLPVIEKLPEKAPEVVYMPDSEVSEPPKGAVCRSCGHPIREGARFCKNCGATIKTVEPACAPKEAMAETKKKASKTPLIVISIILAVVLFLGGIGFGLYVAGVFGNSDDSDTHDVAGKVDDYEYEDIEEDDTDADTETDSEKDKDTDTEKGDKDIETEKKVPVFEFDISVLKPKEEPVSGYNPIRVDTYSFEAIVPADFVCTAEGDGWVTYVASDNTARMMLYGQDNYYGYTVEQELERYKNEIGGTVTYEASGKTWFAVSIEVDGICYYRKCFVDHYIRTFDFVCMHEHLDIYDEYINEIEDNFRRLDV